MGSQYEILRPIFVRYIGFAIEPLSWRDSRSDVKVRILIGHSLHTSVLNGLFRIYLFSKVWIRWGVKELYLLYTIGSIDGTMHAYSEETLYKLQRVLSILTSLI
jgi:hypothetical protein